MKHSLSMIGYFRVMLFGIDGEILRTAIIPNGITNEGKNLMLDVMFHAETQIDPWYISLIDTVDYSDVDATDTMPSHAGWKEYQNYSEANRVEWDEDAADEQSIVNPPTSYSEFTIVGNQVLKGLFITSDNTKGGVVGKLWSTALFEDSNIGGDWSVDDGQVIKVQYGVSIAS